MLVLGASVLVMTVGVSAAILARTNMRAAQSDRAWDHATTAAHGALEVAGHHMNTHSAWRTGPNPIGPMAIGSATAVAIMLDPVDGDLDDDDTEGVRVYCIAHSGSATRYCSMAFTAGAINPLDALTRPMHSGGTLSIGANAYVQAGAGPLSAGVGLSIDTGATVNGSVLTGVLSSRGTVTGKITTGGQSIALPDAAAWTALSASAVRITFSSTSGLIERVALTPSQNPWGLPSLSGTYIIAVPAGQKLTIRSCRIDASLLVELGAGATLEIVERVLWDPENGGIAMLVRAPEGGDVLLGNSVAPFSESAINANLNPLLAPYQGTSDILLDDTYEPAIRGVVHISGSPRTRIGDGFGLFGSLIVEGDAAINGSVTITTDPALIASPPQGFTKPREMRPVLGSYRWETLATLETATSSVSSPILDAATDLLGDVTDSLGITTAGAAQADKDKDK